MRLVSYTDTVADEFLIRTTGESRWTSKMATDIEEPSEIS